MMSYGHQEYRQGSKKIRDRKRRRAKGCLTGIVLYAVVVTAALFIVLVMYGSKVRAENESGTETRFRENGWEPGEQKYLESGMPEEDVFISGDGVAEEFDLSAWNMILVNKWNPVPDDYQMELAEIEQGYQVDARITADLEQMLEDARKEGLSPRICSAYRSNQKQVRLYNNKVREYLNKGWATERSQDEAGKWVAVPGTSEHETGLAVDIVAASYQILDEKQEETKEQKWLMENSYKYGFVLRYPNDKSAITGIYYEPWHYRYVGKAAAKEMHESGVCLEEYREMLLESGNHD